MIQERRQNVWGGQEKGWGEGIENKMQGKGRGRKEGEKMTGRTKAKKGKKKNIFEEIHLKKNMSTLDK